MIYHGDLFDVLPTLAEASVEVCVTDPPYELGFMGKAWDATGVAVRPETWALVLRTLKPGAYLAAFGGTRTFHRVTSAIEDAGFEIRDCLSWLYGSGFPKSLNLGDGRGTALKPAWEPIVLARKPLIGSVAANVQRHGTGALNIDACRIAGENTERVGFAEMGFGGGNLSSVYRTGSSIGRWPSNVLLDEDAAALLDGMSGELTAGVAVRHRSGGNTFGGNVPKAPMDDMGYSDSGGASRFFYVAKPSRAERDKGTYGLESKQRDESRKDGNPGGDNPRNRGLQQRLNYHPTVKPVELMRYLVKLVTPIDGTVLDPFTGSGTTGMACAFEGRKFIGIEREAEYVEIARRRIADCVPLFGESA